MILGSADGMGRVAWLLTGILFGGVLLNSCTTATPTPARPNSRVPDYQVESGVGTGKRFRDNRYFAEEVATETLRDDGLHDPENPAIKALQEPAESLARFPQDRRGGVNWVQAIDQGLIQPRETLSGKEGMLVMDMDILFTDTGSMPWVRFPHLAHTRWLDCSNCHPNIFIPRKGANNPSMDGILAGEHCGRCHDKVAFSLWICERCHSVPHDKSPKKWW
jgi:c(7)-type cytochrome triheme protein